MIITSTNQVIIDGTVVFQCHDQNYSHRTVCYKCKTPKPTQSSSQCTTGYVREPGEIGAVSVPESLNTIVTSRPTSVLLLRGISVHTSEEGIASALNGFAPVLQVCVILTWYIIVWKKIICILVQI